MRRDRRFTRFRFESDRRAISALLRPQAELFVILRNAEHYRFGVGVLRLRGDRTRFLGPAPPIFRVLCLASWAMLGKREIALALRGLQKSGVSLQPRVRLAPTQARSSCDLLITPTISCGTC
jgi:hypothetical protein